MIDILCDCTIGVGRETKEYTPFPSTTTAARRAHMPGTHAPGVAVMYSSQPTLQGEGGAKEGRCSSSASCNNNRHTV